MRSVFAALQLPGRSSVSGSATLPEATAIGPPTSERLCEFCRSLSVEKLCRRRDQKLEESSGRHDYDSETWFSSESDNSGEYSIMARFKRPKLYSLANGCQFCQLLESLAKVQGVTQFEYIALSGVPRKSLHIRFLHRMPTLRETARFGGAIGRLVMQHVMRNSPNVAPLLVQYDPISRIRVDIKMRKHKPDSRTLSPSNPESVYRERSFYLKVLAPTEEAYNLRTYVAGRSTHPAGSAKNIELIKTWLGDCEKKHPGCRLDLVGLALEDNKGKVTLPTRLIDVGTQSLPLMPRLITTDGGQRSQYLALSYCWGQGTTLKLLKSNIVDFHDRIPQELLPQTIRDAIQLVKCLGYQYLWVDSLCIIQDSQEPGGDWQHEAQQMGQYYSNALLVVAALASNSSDDGLFKSTGSVNNNNNSSSAFQHTPVNLPFARKGRQLGQMTVCLPYQTSSLYDFGDEKRRSTWYKRGWVLQERTLARRLLYFGTHQLYWECREDMLSEDGDVPIDHGLETMPWRDRSINAKQWAAKGDFHISYNALHAANMTSMALGNTANSDNILFRMPGLARLQNSVVETRAAFETEKHKFVFDAWIWLMENFCSCELTNLNDKLTAIEGIANVICRSVGATHYFGLWLEVVEMGLLWRGRRALSKKGHDQAPSWSWATWHEPIEFPFLSFGHSQALKRGFVVSPGHSHLDLHTDIWSDLVVKQVAVSFSACDVCEWILVDDEEHYCCRICSGSDYYCLCLPCTQAGFRCPGSESGHWMIKRSSQAGYLTDDTTNRLAPRSMVKRKILGSARNSRIHANLFSNETAGTSQDADVRSTGHEEQAERSQPDGTPCADRYSRYSYGPDESRGSLEKKMALWLCLTECSSALECCGEEGICRHRWIFHEDWTGPIGLVEFDQVSNFPDTISCIILQHDHMGKDNKEGQSNKWSSVRVPENSNQENEHNTSIEEINLESERVHEGGDGNSGDNDDDSDRESNLYSRFQRSIADAKTYLKFRYGMTINPWSTGDWYETSRESKERMEHMYHLSQYGYKEMQKATLPILACTKNTTGDAYLRAGIGVIFDVWDEFWAPAFRDTGYPKAPKGFSVNVDIRLA